MNPLTLYAILAAISLPAPVLWPLFTLAGLAFAWGGSGIAVRVAEHHARRPVPVVFLVDREWLAFAATRDMTAVSI